MEFRICGDLQAGYPGLPVIISEKARAEAEIAAACTSLRRRLHVWPPTEGLFDTQESRVTACLDPLEAVRLLNDRILTLLLRLEFEFPCGRSFRISCLALDVHCTSLL